MQVYPCNNISLKMDTTLCSCHYLWKLVVETTAFKMLADPIHIPLLLGAIVLIGMKYEL